MGEFKELLSEIGRSISLYTHTHTHTTEQILWKESKAGK